MTSVNSYGDATLAGNSIYVLRDPRFRGKESIRYVGKTSWPLQRRLELHFKGREYLRGKNHKVNWLRALEREGLRPTIKLIERVVGEDWQSREIYWIARLGGLGCPLTNGTAGGDGVRIYDEAVRERMRASARAKPPMTKETKEKLSRLWKGRKHSEESKAKMSVVQREICKGKDFPKISPEGMARRLAYQKSKPPPSAETREKMRAAALAYQARKLAAKAGGYPNDIG